VKNGPRFGGAEKLRLVQLNGPLSDVVPSGKSRGRLQRIPAVANKEIAQAELAGIRFHTQTSILSRT
jgi:hypothetical protein